MRLQVDINQVKEFLNDDMTTMEISNLSGVAYTTVRDLRMNLTQLEKASFSTLFKLNQAYLSYEKLFDSSKDAREKKYKRIESALNMLRMDGIVLNEEDLKPYYDYAEGKISLAELDEVAKQELISNNT